MTISFCSSSRIAPTSRAIGESTRTFPCRKFYLPLIRERAQTAPKWKLFSNGYEKFTSARKVLRRFFFFLLCPSLSDSSVGLIIDEAQHLDPLSGARDKVRWTKSSAERLELNARLILNDFQSESSIPSLSQKKTLQSA